MKKQRPSSRQPVELPEGETGRLSWMRLEPNCQQQAFVVWREKVGEQVAVRASQS
jgi:hypothetical protein